MRKHRKTRRLRGVALAEAALVMTLLVLVTLAAVQYGWLLLCAQRVTNAARQGARMEAVLNPPPGVEVLMEGMVADMTPAPDGTISTSGGIVTATLSVPARTNPKVHLINWNLLPVPTSLRAEVRMAKEGQFGAGT